MKTILALLIAVTTLASAQVRTEPPKEVSLRNARVTSKEFKEAHAEVERKLRDEKMREVGEEGWGPLLQSMKTKDHPFGIFITEKDFYQRLKKGEKFTIEKTTTEKCGKCGGKKPADCAPCKGRGEIIVMGKVTYTW